MGILYNYTEKFRETDGVGSLNNLYPVREESASQNIQPGRLPNDITLHFQSISLVDGHAGSEVVYQPALHRAYNYSYSMQKKSFVLRLIDQLKGKDGYHTSCTCRYVDLPDSIVTRQDAESFLRTNFSSWFH